MSCVYATELPMEEDMKGGSRSCYLSSHEPSRMVQMDPTDNGPCVNAKKTKTSPSRPCTRVSPDEYLESYI